MQHQRKVGLRRGEPQPLRRFSRGSCRDDRYRRLSADRAAGLSASESAAADLRAVWARLRALAHQYRSPCAGVLLSVLRDLAGNHRAADGADPVMDGILAAAPQRGVAVFPVVLHHSDTETQRSPGIFESLCLGVSVVNAFLVRQTPVR